MITFNTQEEFDEAVVKAVEKMLDVKVHIRRIGYWKSTHEIEVALIRKEGDEGVVIYDKDTWEY